MENVLNIVIMMLCIVGIILVAIAFIGVAKRKLKINPQMVKVIWICTFACVVIFGKFFLSEKYFESDAKEQKSENVDNMNDDQNIKYDSLQKIFLEISYNTKQNDMDMLIKKYKVYVTKIETSIDQGTIDYNVVMKKKKQYNDLISCDSLNVSFDKCSKKFRYAEYKKVSTTKKSAVLYHHGLFYGFSNDKKTRDYSGYYLNDQSIPDKGILIQYASGVAVETDFYPCDNAKDVLQRVLSN